MRLISIPESKYLDYKVDLMFDAYKWDPQFLDNNTVAKYALAITESEYEELKDLTEKIDKETIVSEEFLNNNLKLAKKLALPKKITRELKRMENYDSKKHIRLMRYDFHPINNDNKWAVSEVNSDVPGGFAESSLMPKKVIEVLELDKSEFRFIDFSKIIIDEICKKVSPGGRIMFVHCTSFSDDRQVMQFLGDILKQKGYDVFYGAADHVRFKDKEAISVLSGNEGKIDLIFRFTPLEWIKDIKPKHWDGYFDTITCSCNHPIAIFAQTKRFPLIWELLEKEGIDLSYWKKYLPKTVEVKDVKNDDKFIFKPACGRVGEKISIKEACRDDEYVRILKDVKKHPKMYLAQEKFESKALKADDGKEYHVCLGSYTVNGLHSGFYARISNLPRIDSNAADIPVIIERDK